MRSSARRRSRVRNGLITASILTAVTALGFLFEALDLQEINIYTLFVLGILLTATMTASRSLSVLASVGGILLFNFLFAAPRFSIEAQNFGYPLDLVVLAGVALLASSLKRNSERMAYRTRVLLEADQRFLKANGAEEILAITAEQLIQLLERPVVFYMRGEEGGELGPARCFGGTPGAELDAQAARWAYRNGEEAGARSARFARAEYLYTGIRTDARVYGVLGVHAGERPMTELEQRLSASVVSECALALERDFYNQKRQQAAVQARNEKLRADLLRSISHDLRTPLTSIAGSAGLLEDQADVLSGEEKRRLYRDIRKDAMWLLGTVENLIGVTRIEEGRMALKPRPELMNEVVGEAVQRMEKRAAAHALSTEQEDDLLMARIDARLIVQVIVNLVDNAVTYTPPGTAIVVRTLRRDGMVAVEVEDDGPGLPPGAEQQVFERFYTTATGDARRGLGLGLALCKAIITAHGGSIWAENRPPHGARFVFTLQEERIELQ